MTKIKFTVAGQQLKRLTMPYLVRDSKRHIQLDFTFMTKGWTDCIKTVVFKSIDGNEGSKILGENNTMRLPTKIAASESFTVSVFGVNLTDDIRITTNPVEIILNESGYSEVGEIEEPPPSVYEQILEKLENIGEPDPETIDKAVRDYLENNPIQGINGYSPIVSIEPIEGGHRVTITDVEGEKSFDVLDGKNGKDGYTPIKGVDYFDGEKGEKGDKGDPYTLTEADKIEITNAVIEALPKYNGEVAEV